MSIINALFWRASKLSSKLKPLSLKSSVSEEFKQALDFLGVKKKYGVKPNDVIALSRLSGAITFLLLLLNALITGFSAVNILLTTLLPLLVMHLVTEYPKNLAVLKRIEALDNTPNIIISLIVSLKQNANLERAVAFTVKYNKGLVIEDLKQALWNCWSGKAESMSKQLSLIALKWGEYSTGFKRSLFLIQSSLSEKNEFRRQEILDKALSVALEDIKFQFKGYVEGLKTPTLFLFSFGTIIPLLIVSLLPMISVISSVTLSSLQILLILVGSLLITYFYSNHIIRKKPSGFSNIIIPEGVKGLPGKGKLRFMRVEFNAYLYPLLIGLVISVPGLVFLLGQLPGVSLTGWLSNPINELNTLTIIWGLGVGLSIYWYGRNKPKLELRNRMRELEKGIIDALYQVASRMSEGRSVEESIKWVSKVLGKGEVSELFSKTSDLVRKRNFTLEQAFFDEGSGSLREVFSKRVKAIIRVLVNASKQGVSVCANTLFSVTRQYSDLNRVEEELKQGLTQSLGMMHITAVFFAPIICGLIISMQQLIQQTVISVSEELSGSGFSGITRFLDTSGVHAISRGFLHAIALFNPREVRVLNQELKRPSVIESGVKQSITSSARSIHGNSNHLKNIT